MYTIGLLFIRYAHTSQFILSINVKLNTLKFKAEYVSRRWHNNRVHCVNGTQRSILKISTETKPDRIETHRELFQNEKMREKKIRQWNLSMGDFDRYTKTHCAPLKSDKSEECTIERPHTWIDAHAHQQGNDITARADATVQSSNLFLLLFIDTGKKERIRGGEGHVVSVQFWSLVKI